MAARPTHIYVSTGSFESAFGNRNAAVILDELAGYGVFSQLHAVFFRADRHADGIHVREDVTAHDLAWEGWPRAAAEVAFLRWLLSLVRRSRPCVLTAADPFLSALNVQFVAAIARCPWVQYLGSDFESIWQTSGVRVGHIFPGRFFERAFERHAYRSARRVRTWNQYYRDYALSMGAARERCIVLPPAPFNDAYYGPETAASGRIFAANNGPVVAVIQRLQRDKLTAEILEAFPIVHERRPNVQFVIAGDGPERPALERKVQQLGLSEVVDFVGHLGIGDIIALMQRADVLVGGNAGRTLVEAALCGVETVTFDFHWHPEYVRLMRAGAVTPLFDAGRMATAILDVLTRASPAHRSTLRNRASEIFGRAAVIERTRAFYRELIAC